MHATRGIEVARCGVRAPQLPLDRITRILALKRVGISGAALA
jgi:hypothetical protein